LFVGSRPSATRPPPPRAEPERRDVVICRHGHRMLAAASDVTRERRSARCSDVSRSSWRAIASVAGAPSGLPSRCRTWRYSVSATQRPLARNPLGRAAARTRRRRPHRACLFRCVTLAGCAGGLSPRESPRLGGRRPPLGCCSRRRSVLDHMTIARTRAGILARGTVRRDGSSAYAARVSDDQPVL
jgi:hypothetical protein